MKMLHEGLVWKISMGGASPLRGAGFWRSYSYMVASLFCMLVVLHWPPMLVECTVGGLPAGYERPWCCHIEASYTVGPQVWGVWYGMANHGFYKIFTCLMSGTGYITVYIMVKISNNGSLSWNIIKFNICWPETLSKLNLYSVASAVWGMGQVSHWPEWSCVHKQYRYWQTTTKTTFSMNCCNIIHSVKLES